MIYTIQLPTSGDRTSIYYPALLRLHGNRRLVELSATLARLHVESAWQEELTILIGSIPTLKQRNQSCC